MPDNRLCQTSHGKECICIDTYRVLDSCRDKDCFENVKVYLTEFGEEIIERTCNIRAKCAEVVCAYIDVNDVPFNRGFYQLNIRIYTKIIFEACVSPCNIQEFEGIAVVEKKVILFGSEGNVKVFTSDCHNECDKLPHYSSTAPRAKVQVVDPICLDLRLCSAKECCSCPDDKCIPRNIAALFDGQFVPYSEEKAVKATLGVFTIVQLERDVQMLIPAYDFCVPTKECCVDTMDPCDTFKKIHFPVDEFFPPNCNSHS